MHQIPLKQAPNELWHKNSDKNSDKILTNSDKILTEILTKFWQNSGKTLVKLWQKYWQKHDTKHLTQKLWHTNSDTRALTKISATKLLPLNSDNNSHKICDSIWHKSSDTNSDRFFDHKFETLMLFGLQVLNCPKYMYLSWRNTDNIPP